MDDVKGPDNPEYFERLVSEYQGQLRRLCCGWWIPKRRRASGRMELNTFPQSKKAPGTGDRAAALPSFSALHFRRNGKGGPRCRTVRFMLYRFLQIVYY